MHFRLHLLPAALLGAGLIVPAGPASAQEIDMGPISGPETGFTGTWWDVGRPLQSSTVYRHQPDGALLRLEGNLEAESYRVVGDSVLMSGGMLPLMEGGDTRSEFRIVGDTMWFGRDEVPKIRVAPALPEARDPLQGWWAYSRHGGSFLMDFTPDGRLIRWMIQTAEWESGGGDTIILKIGRRRSRYTWTARDRLLVLTPVAGGEPTRLLRIEEADHVRPGVSALHDPSFARCEWVRDTAERFLHEERIDVYDDTGGPWGHFDHRANRLRLARDALRDPGRAPHVTAHLVAHSLGFGTTPDTEWIAEEVARSCTR